MPHRDAGSVLNVAILCFKIYTMPPSLPCNDAASVDLSNGFSLPPTTLASIVGGNEKPKILRTLAAYATASEAPRLRHRVPGMAHISKKSYWILDHWEQRTGNGILKN